MKNKDPFEFYKSGEKGCTYSIKSSHKSAGTGRRKWYLSAFKKAAS